jgi:hypothetical protein
MYVNGEAPLCAATVSVLLRSTSGQVPKPLSEDDLEVKRPRLGNIFNTSLLADATTLFRLQSDTWNVLWK